MNSQQAKEILILFRPGSADGQDPQIAQALELVKQDPELGRWFEEHCAFQEAVRSRFRRIPVPEGLKEQILSERWVRTRANLRRRTAGWTLATVALILLCALTSLWLAPAENPSFAVFRDRLPRKVVRQYPRMDLRTADLGQIQRHLTERGRGDYVLPDALTNKTQATGCAVFPWHGRTVSMICFNSGKTATPNAPDLFLFIVSRAAVSRAPLTTSPQFVHLSRQLTAASWSCGDNAYVLAALGDEAFLRERL